MSVRQTLKELLLYPGLTKNLQIARWRIVVLIVDIFIILEAIILFFLYNFDSSFSIIVAIGFSSLLIFFTKYDEATIKNFRKMDSLNLYILLFLLFQISLYEMITQTAVPTFLSLIFGILIVAISRIIFGVIEMYQGGATVDNL